MWSKDEYIKDRTQYWINDGLLKRFAIECAEEDWQRYCEKYGIKS